MDCFRFESAGTRSLSLVLWKDVMSRETFFGLVSSEVFLAWYLYLGPVSGTDTDDPTRPDAFKDEVSLEFNLDTAAPERSNAFFFGYGEDAASAGHMGGTVSSMRMFQGVLDRIHHGGNILLEVGVEGIVHAAEEGGGNGCGAKFTILDRIDPPGHPTASYVCLVGLGLVAGGPLHGKVVQPDVGDVKAGKDTVR